MPDWIALLIPLVPLLALMVILFVAARRARVRRRIATVPRGWIRTLGVVVSEREFSRSQLDLHGDRFRVQVRQPVISFKDPAGREITFPSRIFAAAMPRPGAFVEVLYDPTDPTRARIAPESVPTVGRSVSTWTLVVGMVVAVVLFLGVLATGIAFLNA
ncbi:DUF3592 domain-containing protein [Nakamurella flavida]|uniref:DUF3592 domain-containing protein n=1 Tax=Nakamurella flavida TaxID=363630 RepID=A0A938YI51_9ACTN|nr:DUF3592 domain-containing protein [Nakamurella flavida]MBM9476362.1 DUF3592 domain-containing protein [Nakamurella flavida]MDP9779538.1 hypothetical protein [Nakamurella flavida]